MQYLCFDVLQKDIRTFGKSFQAVFIDPLSEEQTLYKALKEEKEEVVGTHAYTCCCLLAPPYPHPHHSPSCGFEHDLELEKVNFHHEESVHSTAANLLKW